jgi:hypothetical protein
MAVIGAAVTVASPAHAEPDTVTAREAAIATAPELDRSRPATITLPTGDQVRLTADGSYITEPATDGTAAFHNAREPDGDRLVIPVDALPKLADGSLALGQFNIDALSRNGIADATDVGTAALSETDIRSTPRDGSPALVEVDFTALWPDGSAPEVTFLRWLDIDTGEYSSEILDGGTGTLEMAPGHYHMVPTMDKSDELTSISGVLDLHIDAAPEPIVFDGKDAVPVGFELDRETTPEWLDFTAYSYLPGTDDGVQGGLTTSGDWMLAAVPTDWDTTGRDVGLSLRQEFVSPEGAEEPYSYSLFEAHTEGIPADPVFRVTDDELARIDMDYDSLGVDTTMYRLNLATHTVQTASGYLDNGDVDLPSERTEFYSAGPDLKWSHAGYLRGGEADLTADVLHHSGVLEPGENTEIGWNQGPVTVGVDLAGAEYFYDRMTRATSLDLLLTNPSLFSSGSPDEAVNTYEMPGQTVLSQNGLGVNKSEYGGTLATELTLVPEGRYQLYAEATRNAPWTVLGTAATAEWDFATAPSDEDVPLAVSVVNFEAEGIENGYADAEAAQRIDLEYATQPGAEQQVCTAMTFEVSYDDGATWTPVAIDRDGNRATAELTHPEDAEFVSVRFTAADEAGNTVSHSTIRSYGLK